METLNARAARDARIISLQAQLLDHSGHVSRGLSRDDARILLDEINWLRERNDWQPLDMTGRWQRRHPIRTYQSDRLGRVTIPTD